MMVSFPRGVMPQSPPQDEVRIQSSLTSSAETKATKRSNRESFEFIVFQKRIHCVRIKDSVRLYEQSFGQIILCWESKQISVDI